MVDNEEVVTIPPRVGQGVRYVSDDYSHLPDGSPSEVLPAVVIGVHEDGSVDLRVGNFTAGAVSFDAGGATGTWHWPGRE